MRHNGRLEKKAESFNFTICSSAYTHTRTHTHNWPNTLLISHTGLQPGLITLLFRKDSCRRWISSFREKLWSVYAGCRCRWPTSAVDKLRHRGLDSDTDTHTQQHTCTLELCFCSLYFTVLSQGHRNHCKCLSLTTLNFLGDNYIQWLYDRMAVAWMNTQMVSGKSVCALFNWFAK